MELYDIVNKLVGPTRPIGDSVEDAKRLANLKKLTELVDKLLTDIDHIADEFVHREEWSMKQAGRHCAAFLDTLGIRE